MKFFILLCVISTLALASSQAFKGDPDSTAKLNELDQLRNQLRQNLQQITALKASIERKSKSDRVHLGPSYDLPALCQGRLTLTSNTPVETANVTGATTLYFTPYLGSTISLYNGSIWQAYTFSQLSLTLTGLTTGTNYDVFVYNNAGVLTLTLGAAWTNNTTRSAAISLQNGVYVLSSNTGYKYVGTIRTTGTTTTEDSTNNRFVWNYYNRLIRYLWMTSAATNWTYNSATWRAADGSTANAVNFVIGISDVLTFARVQNAAGVSTGAGAPAANGIGLDSTTVNSATVYGENVPIYATYGFSVLTSEYFGYPSIGYHYFQWLESASATTVTFVTSNGNAFQSGGLFGEIEG